MPAQRKLINIDLTGKAFSSLTAVRLVRHGPKNNLMWECLCQCGKTAFVLASYLIDGKQISCGCGRLGYTHLEGQRFSRLVVLSQEPRGIGAGKRKWKDRRWRCVCDCGKEKVTTASSLTTGHTRSCGCLRVEWAMMESRKRHLPPMRAAINKALKSYRLGARSRSLSYDLSESQSLAIMAINCFYCGSPPSNIVKERSKGAGDFVYSGIDRIDPSQGYTVVNCVPCCIRCNMAKGTINILDFMDWITDLAWHRILSSTSWKRFRRPCDEAACAEKVKREQWDRCGSIISELTDFQRRVVSTIEKKQGHLYENLIH